MESKVVSPYERVVDNSLEYRPQEGQQPTVSDTSDEVSGTTQEASEQVQAESSSKQEGPSADFLKEIKAQLDSLNQHLITGKQEQQQDPLGEIDKQLVALQEQARNGDITYDEMILKTAPLLEQRVLLKVQSEQQRMDAERRAQAAQESFLQENPDFVEFAKSDEAKLIQQANPIFDPVSAYFAWKAKSVEQALQQKDVELAELRKQMERSIQKAAERQGVISGTGVGKELDVPNVYRGDGLGVQEGGLAALRRARMMTTSK